jgi:hypothetical protein
VVKVSYTWVEYVVRVAASAVSAIAISAVNRRPEWFRSVLRALRTSVA